MTRPSRTWSRLTLEGLQGVLVVRSSRVNLLHVLLGLVIELLLDVGGGLLVLLVLGHQVVHVGLRLSELHLIHALACVPMEESLPSEHSGELLADPLENLLDG